MTTRLRMNFYTCIGAILALFVAVGCGTPVDSDPETDEPSKSEIADQISSGKADHSTDWCAVFDWYDDGVCDDFCALPDPDCGDAHEPCGGLTCGETCSLCAPGDPECFETAVVKVCQADGSCGPRIPACGDDDKNDDKNNDNDDSYDPCGGLTCGDLCSVCDPNDPNCVETAVVKMCQSDGSCQATVPACGDDDGGEDYDPCEGLACGERCTLCAPGDTDCFETADLKYCHADGTCSGTEPDTCDPSGQYDPCDGKVCGDTCQLCDPNDPDCFETLEVKQCNGEGVCSSAAAYCQ